MTEIRCIADAAAAGNPKAAAELFTSVYDELRHLAAAHMRQEPAAHTLQATALVHEAYLSLFASARSGEWESEGHFLAAASRVMRNILIDAARRRKASKRGGGMKRHGLDDVPEPAAADADEHAEHMLALDRALTELATTHPRAAQVVELRRFAGLKIHQVAKAIGVSPRTVDNDWAYACAWIAAFIHDKDAKPPD